LKNNENNEDYVTVKIPKELADEIDRIIKSKTLGYRTRAEMVNDAIRLRIELLRFNNSLNSNNSAKNKKE
jgi:metal-responsive CopG/Arc/MetJ family transcriptional regulator